MGGRSGPRKMSNLPIRPAKSLKLAIRPARKKSWASLCYYLMRSLYYELLFGDRAYLQRLCVE